MDVRSNAPSKRRRISTSSQMEHVQRTVRTEESRELLEPSEDDGTDRNDEGGDDVGVLRIWRAMCPELQEHWPEDEQPEDWLRMTMENGRVVELDLECFDLTGAVPAEIGQLTSLRVLDLSNNDLRSVPAAAIRKLRAAGCYVWLDDGVTFAE